MCQPKLWQVSLINNMIGIIAGKTKQCRIFTRMTSSKTSDTSKFVTVFSFPFVKKLALLSRLKTYHILGSSLAVPGSGLLEMLNILPDQSFFSTVYIGVTGAAVLSLASLPFTNAIGFLYISEDNKLVKISSIDFWGKRVDRIVPVDEWIPLLDMLPKKMDAVYLSPQLTDKTKYKWFVKFGNVLNREKIGQVLE